MACVPASMSLHLPSPIVVGTYLQKPPPPTAHCDPSTRHVDGASHRGCISPNSPAKSRRFPHSVDFISVLQNRVWGFRYVVQQWHSSACWGLRTWRGSPPARPASHVLTSSTLPCAHARQRAPPSVGPHGSLCCHVPGLYAPFPPTQPVSPGHEIPHFTRCSLSLFNDTRRGPVAGFLGAFPP